MTRLNYNWEQGLGEVRKTIGTKNEFFFLKVPITSDLFPLLSLSKPSYVPATLESQHSRQQASSSNIYLIILAILAHYKKICL